MYVREAQRKVPFQIFKCDIFTEDTSGRKETLLRYFVNGIMMGASIEGVHAKQESKKDKRPLYVDGLDYYLDKTKKTAPICVDVNANYIEPGTEVLVSRVEKNMMIEDMQICNTPKPYFFGYKPDPLSDYIEVSIMTQSASRMFRNELENRENFKRHSEPEIVEAFKDLFVNMTVESIVVERAEGMKEMIKILVDGLEINNVDKFKITPAYTTKGLPLTLPVRCFLPFES